MIQSSRNNNCEQDAAESDSQAVSTRTETALALPEGLSDKGLV